MANTTYLDLAGLQEYDKKIKTKVAADDATTLASAKNAVNDAKSAVESKIGTLDDLTMTNKTDLVVALNEVAASIESGGTGSVVKISTETTTEGYAKSYTFTQGSTKLGVIDIPKDMVVSSGTVEKDPKDQPAGTYLVLTLANATNDKVYINVGTLHDYKIKVEILNIQIIRSKAQITNGVSEILLN